MYSSIIRLSITFFVMCGILVPGVFANADDFLSGLEKIINASVPVTQTGTTSSGQVTTPPAQTPNASPGSTTAQNPGTSAPASGSSSPSTGTTVKPVIPVPASSVNTSSQTNTPSSVVKTNPPVKRQNLATTESVENTSAASAAGLVLNSASNAPVCKLPEVQSVFVREYPDKSTIRWASVVGAAGYDIMKKTVSGDFVLVERVTEPVYTLYLAAGDITYDHFKIAAVCPESGTASPRTSVVTRVRTGPEQVMLVIFALLVGGGVVCMRRKKSR